MPVMKAYDTISFHSIILYYNQHVDYGCETRLSVRMAEWSKAPDSRAYLALIYSDMGVLVHECGRGFESHF